MASVQTASYGGRYLKLTVVESSTSIENNTSTLKWTLESIGGDVTYYTIYNWGVWVNGECKYDTQTTSWNSYKFPAATGSVSGTVTVKHNADGTAGAVSFTLKGSVYTNNDKTFTGSVSLSTIPRTSKVSINNSNTTTNSKYTISTNRASNSFTHTITYSFGNASGTIGTGVGASIDWTVPRSLAAEIPNSTSGTGTIYCSTYNGSTYIGQSTLSFTVNVDSGIVPTISSSSVSDGNSTVKGKNWGTLLTNLSYLQCEISGSGSQGSTISRYYCKYEGVEYSDTSVANLNNQLKSKALIIGSRSCELWVSDSRGRTSTHVTKTYTVTEYNIPSITSYDVQRCNSSGKISDDGTYFKITLVGSASPVTVSDANKNKFTARIRFRVKNTTDSYTTKTFVNGSTTTFSVNYIGNTAQTYNASASASKSYEILFEIIDTFNTTQRSKDISTGFDLIHFHKSGKSIAFGKKSEASDTESKIEFGMNVDFKSSFMINGKSILDFFYPVGSIYTSMDSTSPETLFGGKWTQISDKFLYCVKSATASKGTGGSTTTGAASGNTGAASGNTGSTTLTLDQIPSHAHTISVATNNTGSATVTGSGVHYFNDSALAWSSGSKTFHIPNLKTWEGSNTTNSQGGGTGHTHTLNSHTHTLNSHTHTQNLPPYMTCYAWYRTS